MIYFSLIGFQKLILVTADSVCVTNLYLPYAQVYKYNYKSMRTLPRKSDKISIAMPGIYQNTIIMGNLKKSIRRKAWNLPKFNVLTKGECGGTRIMNIDIKF